MNTVKSNTVVSLYVVQNTNNGKFFGGWDTAAQETVFTDKPIEAKKFTNKNDIRLRPDEVVIELQVDLAATDVKVSEPFRPARRRQNNFQSQGVSA